MILSFENMNVSKKVNRLLRTYDLFVHGYAKVTQNGINYVSLVLFRKAVKKSNFPKGAP